MDDTSRVHWHEGMFLRAQHFQQSERHRDAVLAGCLRGVAGLGWGFRRLRLDSTLFKNGMIGLTEAEGIMPDGTYFEIDERTRPEPLEIEPTMPAGVVRLVLPAREPGKTEVDEPGRPATDARYVGDSVSLRDTASSSDRKEAIKICRPRFRLLHEAQAQGRGMVSLGVVRVTGRGPQKDVLRDEAWLPPALTIGVVPDYGDIVRGVESSLTKLAEQRRPFVQEAVQHGAGTTRDLFALAIAQRAQRQAAHMNDQQVTHPELLYAWLTGLAGELLALVRAGFREPQVEPYRHESPSLGLRSVQALLRAIFAELLGELRPFRELELHWHRPAQVYSTLNVAGEVFTKAELILGVHADEPPGRLRDDFLLQTVIGPTDEFDDLWFHKTPGVPLRWRERRPAVLPAMEGYVFFELDRDNPYWQRLPRSEGLAIGIDGRWRDLQVRLWALLPPGG